MERLWCTYPSRSTGFLGHNKHPPTQICADLRESQSKSSFTVANFQPEQPVSSGLYLICDVKACEGTSTVPRLTELRSRPYNSLYVTVGASRGLGTPSESEANSRYFQTSDQRTGLGGISVQRYGRLENRYALTIEIPVLTQSKYNENISYKLSYAEV